MTLFRYYYWLIKKTVHPLLRHLDKRGVQVILWVVNEEDNLDKILKNNVDGIMTDEPTKIIPRIKELF